VRELVDRILTLMGSALEPDVRNDVRHEIREQYLSAAKARQLLGWAPLYTLEEGLLAAIEWYRSFLAEAAPSVPPRSVIGA
jgi:CDP-glucose 4,6-dehydratase